MTKKLIVELRSVKYDLSLVYMLLKKLREHLNHTLDLDEWNTEFENLS